jgi:inner membrane protein
MTDYRLDQALARGGIETTHRFSAPTPFNTLLWRVVAVDGDDYYEGLTGWFDSNLLELEKLPRGFSAAAPALEGSVQHQRLRWFTRDMLRYDLIEGQWVVTDLRLGMSGFHPFRFALATITEPEGKSELIREAEQWPTPPVEFARIEDLFHRAVDNSYQLSLKDLANTLGDPPLR